MPTSALPGRSSSTSNVWPFSTLSRSAEATITRSPLSSLTVEYACVACTASATLEGKVQGVVVQASKDRPGSPCTPKRTMIEGSSTVL